MSIIYLGYKTGLCKTYSKNKKQRNRYMPVKVIEAHG